MVFSLYKSQKILRADLDNEQAEQIYCVQRSISICICIYYESKPLAFQDQETQTNLTGEDIESMDRELYYLRLYKQDEQDEQFPSPRYFLLNEEQ